MRLSAHTPPRARVEGPVVIGNRGGDLSEHHIHTVVNGTGDVNGDAMSVPGTKKEAPVGIEPTNSRFAVCRLTTWPRRRDTQVIGGSQPVQAQMQGERFSLTRRTAP